ncbi:Mitochondrial import inner membrane translocase subunit Tim9 [Mucor velutinosus]|uniref:Mitochondrial import inner membrane translocase subunit Tim9 n=1 Tax=Mucor velutinosus TaxID=708070 RepID=A0AAN7DSK5_9FUNG|nr:Mitochondrial import inner membrane translocase subunit Tim9 [Mucor velutinosus]
MPEFQHPTDMNQVTVIMQQLQQQLASLSERVNQHDGILARLDALEKENQALKKILHDKDLVIEKLQATSQDSVTSTPIKGASGSTTSATATTDSGTISYSTIAKKAAHRPDPTKATKRKLAAGRLFKTSATKGPQGYQYVYIGRSGKILRSEIRRTLKAIGVDTSRILDINFPASEAIGILLHTQYVAEFLALLRASESEILEDFDPLNPANIADPKYDAYSEHDRMDLIAEMVNARSVDALSHIRPLNVSSVGRWFLDLGWIGQAELDEAVAGAMDRLKEKDPKKAAFLFKRRRDTSTDSEMEI